MMKKLLVPATICALALSGCDFKFNIHSTRSIPESEREKTVYVTSVAYDRGVVVFHWEEALGKDGQKNGCALVTKSSSDYTEHVYTAAALLKAEKQKLLVELEVDGRNKFDCLVVESYKVLSSTAFSVNEKDAWDQKERVGAYQFHTPWIPECLEIRTKKTEFGLFRYLSCESEPISTNSVSPSKQ